MHGSLRAVQEADRRDSHGVPGCGVNFQGEAQDFAHPSERNPKAYSSKSSNARLV